jgi:hypothetical protein
MKEKKSFGYYVGVVLADAVLIAISTCILAVIGSLTFRFVTWIMGGIL